MLSDSIGPNLNRPVSGFARPLATVRVLEPDDVVELRGRDLENRRVLDGLDAVDGAWAKAERRARTDDFRHQDGLPGFTELELRLALEHEPALVLLAMELEAERLAGANEEQLAGVVLGFGPDQLVAPGLLDLVGLEREPIQALEIRRGQWPLHGWPILRLPQTSSHSGCSATYVSARC